MIEFDADDIKLIHSELEKAFPKMEKGIIPERESHHFNPLLKNQIEYSLVLKVHIKIW